MEHRLIHPEGPEFSRIISGAWRWHEVSQDSVEKLIQTSLDCGITTFDHADIYGDHRNEEIFGNVLRRSPSLRQQMQLVTKGGIKFPSAKRPASWIKHYDTSRQHITWAAENSLKMLGTDHIDLLLIHRPDPLLDPEVMAETFGALKKQGKVLHFGVSNFTPTQFELLRHYLPFPLVTNQIEVSLSCTAPIWDGTIDVLMKYKVSPMAWSPLGGGKLVSGDSNNVFGKASKYSATNTQLALAWLLKHPSKIFPVIGTTRPERIRESARALDIRLDVQDWYEMLKIAEGKEVP
ncbi:MAG TPA: aldo/keto reductase [Ohtaekwangia sp.]|nr:aldo/keto reductase [Ohtaekwangia sp.]